MSRERSPDRQRALKIWLKSDRLMKPSEIADKLGVNAAMVRKWKSLDKWDQLPESRNRGAPRGNKNAKGNKGGPGGPPGNGKAVTHGLFRKLLPDDPTYLEIFDATENMTPLDMLWYQIRIKWSNILDSLRKMHVTGKEEMIKELKKQKFEVHSTGSGKNKQLEQVLVEEEFEFQFAWDRQATALKAQSAAMVALARLIKQYDDMLRTIPPDEVQEEHRLRIEKLKLEIDILSKEATNDKDKPIEILIKRKGDA